MAKSVLDIVIRTMKEGGGDKETIKGMVDLKTTFTQAVGIFSAVAGGARLVGAGLNYVTSEASEAQKVDAQLNAVLESTKHAAGLTADEISSLASALQRQTTFTDEAIKSSSALLLTFTQVKDEVFPEAQQAILDMSVAMDQDLKSSTIQLGKALNDPIKGITALTRVGVSFTEEQKSMIRTLTETGDVMGAQKIILEELSKEFGGSAAAAAKTYEGQIQQLKNAWADSAEEAGMNLIPVMTELLTLENRQIQLMQDGLNPYEARRVAAQELTEAHKQEAAAAASAVVSYTAMAQAMQTSGDMAVEATTDYKGLLSMVQQLNNATQQEIKNIAYKQLQADLTKSGNELTEEEAELLKAAGIEMGIFSEEAANTAEQIQELNQQLADGTIKLEAYIKMLNNIPSTVSTDILLNQQMIGAGDLAGVTSQAIGGAQRAGDPYRVHQDEIIVPAQNGYTLTRTDAMNALTNASGSSGRGALTIYGGLTLVVEGGVQDALDELSVMGG